MLRLRGSGDGMSTWQLIDGDVSWQHCGRPAYWDYDTDTEDMEVYCSKCQEMLTDGAEIMDRVEA